MNLRYNTQKELLAYIEELEESGVKLNDNSKRIKAKLEAGIKKRTTDPKTDSGTEFAP